MMFEAKKIPLLLVFVAIMGAMGGCLSKDDSGVEVAAAPAPVPDVQNSLPTISGNPDNAVMIGDMYTFMPEASDADGDPLTFSVENLPTWASFNSSTGEVSGQPLLGATGVFGDISIAVSDGIGSSSLPAFSITVSQVALGSMSFSWTAPTTNSDGSALTNLAGYRIYYGVSEGNYTQRIDIDQVGIATYVVENLLPDTYYIVATSLNAAGVESAYSNFIVRVVTGS